MENRAALFFKKILSNKNFKSVVSYWVFTLLVFLIQSQSLSSHESIPTPSDTEIFYLLQWLLVHPLWFQKESIFGFDSRDAEE